MDTHVLICCRIPRTLAGIMATNVPALLAGFTFPAYIDYRPIYEMSAANDETE